MYMKRNRKREKVNGENAKIGDSHKRYREALCTSLIAFL